MNLPKAARGFGCWFVALILLVLITACKSAYIPSENLSVSELLQLEEGFYAQRADRDRVEKALAVTEALLAKEPKSLEGLWRASKNSAWLADNYGKKSKVLFYSMKGIDYAKRGIALDPTSVESHYYLALNIGYKAKVEKKEGRKIGAAIEKEGKTVVDLDETFNYAGGYRLLGILYRKAPAWPVSVGSLESSLYCLEKAVALSPDYPPNRIELAKTHLEYNDANKAKEQLRIVLRLPAKPDWALHEEYWKGTAAEILDEL